MALFLLPVYIKHFSRYFWPSDDHFNQGTRSLKDIDYSLTIEECISTFCLKLSTSKSPAYLSQSVMSLFQVRQNTPSCKPVTEIIYFDDN